MRAPVITRGSRSATSSESPFHEGERALQEEAVVADRLSRLGPQLVRDHLPEQHRQFYSLLPFIVVGALDGRGQPQATLLVGPPGFVSAPDDRHLRVDALPLPRAPLSGELAPGAPIAVLGIQPHTGRRNRANGRVASGDALGFVVAVEQTFGNCPKYIQRREPRYTGVSGGGRVEDSDQLGVRERALIAAADTFFIASAHPLARSGLQPSHNVDVSHRGGRSGFVELTGKNSFRAPDYRGNNFHNTLGNLRLNPAAGLLFIDFAAGHLLALEATAELEPIPDERRTADGPTRALHFHVQHVRWYPHAAALSWLDGGH